MEKIIAAFATDDGNHYVDRHFGDAQQYLVYEIGKDELSYIGTIYNKTEEEDEHAHADSNKAKGIAQLLKKDKVQILASKKFGANINRMKKKFVCILMNDAQISDSIAKIQQHFDKILAELRKGESRHFLNLKSKQSAGERGGK